MRLGRVFEQFNLVWIEEPLDAYDAEGHAQLANALDTSIATGEMLSSVAEHISLIENRSVDIIQPDAPRIGGITPFLRLAHLADQAGLQLAPHFAMEIHLHWPPPTPANHGSSTSNGSTLCSTSGWKLVTAACRSRTDSAWVHPQ